MPFGIAGKLQLLKETYGEWSSDNAPRLGAALAYYAVFSIPPMLLILIALARTVYHGDISRSIESEFANLINPDAARAMFVAVSENSKHSGIFAEVVGFALLLFGASGVFRELKDSLNTIWRAQAPRTSGLFAYIKNTFLSFAMVAGSTFLLLVSLVLSAAISAIGQRLHSWLPGGEAASYVVDSGLSFVIVTGIFALMYRLLSDLKLEWNDVWIGAAATAALFTIGKMVIGLYLGKAAVGAEYGAAGAVIVLIVWVYYSAQIFFMGAEFTKVYARHHGSQKVSSFSALRSEMQSSNSGGNRV
jgi:membrane protein